MRAGSTAANVTHNSGMGKNHIEAVVLDLDDTLWPIAPVINRAEKALARWIVDNAPAVAAQAVTQ